MEHIKGLRVGIFTETYRPQVNGVVTSIENLKTILIERGCQPIIFTVGGKVGIEREGSVTIHRFKSAPLLLYPEYRYTLPRFQKARKLLEKYPLDLLHTHGPFAMGLNALYAHRKLKIPLVGTFHTLLPEYVHYFIGEKPEKYFGRFVKRYVWRYLKWYYSRCDVVTCPSEITLQLLQEKGFRNVHLLSNGINTNRFTSDLDGSKFRRAYGIGKGEKLVLYLGRIGFEKNLPFIVQAASIIVKQMKGVKFIIAGKGPAKEYLRLLVDKMGVRKHFVFTGFIPDEILPHTYAAANVFVIASSTDTQGLTILEAMAAGKPIVVAYRGVSKELVKDRCNGFIAENLEEFAEKIMEILRSDDLERRMGEESRRMVEKHSLERVGEQIEQLYRLLL